MKTVEASSDMAPVREALHAGELIVVPTDTVYGIACLATDAAAYERLCQVKGRDPAQPTAALFASHEELFGALPSLSAQARRVCEQLLPGPYTFVVANQDEFAPWICGAPPTSIGVRIPDGALDLPPLAATSANLHGQPDARTVPELSPRLVQEVSWAVDAGPRRQGVASTVVDLTAWEQGGEPVVLRDQAGRAEALVRRLAELV